MRAARFFEVGCVSNLFKAVCEKEISRENILKKRPTYFYA